MQFALLRKGTRRALISGNRWNIFSAEIHEANNSFIRTGTPYLRIYQAIIKKCAEEKKLSLGLACHAQLLHYGFQADTLTSNMLINMYSKSGNVVYCRAVFDQMHVKSAVSWNTIIAAYAVNDAGDCALQLFVRMIREGSEMSEFALSSVLCGCASKVLAFESKQLHAFAIKSSMELNKFVGTALVDVYAKCRFVDDAFRMFEIIPEKSDVTWSSMMAGFVQNELYEQALKLFRLERRTYEDSNMFVISSVISACAATGALMQGKHVHAVVHKSGFEANRYISSSLVDMYAKCGCIEESYIVFSAAEVKNVVVWNAIISGFARNGRSVEAIILFEKMQQMSCRPNEITYVSLLSACAHMRLAEEGRKYFVMLKKQHGLSANALHYACMVDVLGRTGNLDEAKDMIEEMPFEATASMWGSILGCCRVFRNVELGEIAAKKLFEIEPENGGNHVLLSNIYAACGRWDGVALVRELLKKTGAKKERGESWIEVGGEVHRFAVGDTNHHPRMDEVYARLNAMADEMEGSGFEWRMEEELHDVGYDLKREYLKQHSEKLAFVFGLLYLPSGAPIRIMKNLRMCGDCHEFMKFASAMTPRREIIVRDNRRFHHFRDGWCSCRGFW